MSLTAAQNERNEKAIATLLPEVQSLCRKHLALLATNGIDVIIPQALRTQSEQDALHAQGRTAPGKIVTNAHYGYSWHCFGRAYDIAVVKAGSIFWDGPEYTKAGSLGQTLGLVWGGSFKAIKGDVGHFEYHPGLELADARKQAGIQA
jgi:peptidoglycan L-alanyl-D-glutamate endopeptidase CwlK